MSSWHSTEGRDQMSHSYQQTSTAWSSCTRTSRETACTRTMETPRETDRAVVMQAFARVLMNPTLWRCISSFQRGIPMPLYTFWITQEPSMAHADNRKLYPSIINVVVQHVVQYGTPELLAFIPHVRFYSINQWRTPTFDGLVQHAIRANRPDMLECMIVHHAIAVSPVDLWRAAIVNNRGGDERVLDVLHRYKPISGQEMRRLTEQWTVNLTNTALVGWFAANYPEAFDPQIMTKAVIHGSLELVQCLHQHFPTTYWGFDPYHNALMRGRVEILTYLVEKRPHDIDARLVRYFIDDRYSEVVATFKGAIAFRETAREVATGYTWLGDQHLLQRLYEMEWLEDGEPVSIDQAAGKGRLDCIKFLVERGLAAATTDAMDLAAEAKKWDVVYYLHEQGIGGCTTRVMDAAAAEGELGHVQFFHENRSEGCTTRAMDEAASVGHLEVVRFLHANRSEGCTTRAMDEAARYGDLPMVSFLHEHRSEGCTTDGLNEAAKRGHVEVVELLQRHQSGG